MELSKTLWTLNIPLLACRSYGFIGSIRLQISEHTIIESHPDNTNPDLRLDKPWPALLEYVDNMNLESLDVSKIWSTIAFKTSQDRALSRGKRDKEK